MKKDDLIDSMGRIDDDLVQNVDALRKKKKKSRRTIFAVAAAACLVLVVTAVGFLASPWSPEEDTGILAGTEEPEGTSGSDQQSGTDVQSGSFPADSMVRLQLLDFSSAEEYTSVPPSVEPYSVSEGLTNVVNLDQFYLSDEERQLLEQNLFVVSGTYNSEFFQTYEYNRYDQVPNYVTVDSLMHTYHLYFSLLLNRTEKNYLADDLLALSKAMLETSVEQYGQLAGTQWEEAARRNAAYFAVAASLQDPAQEVPSYAAELVQRELDLVYAAEGIAMSPLAEDFMDYSQYKPRGYYEGDEVLEKYFRAMMWYGQVNFAQDNDSLSRSALLMTLAMARTDLETWEKIYTVTAFFAGVSDDLGYYEYAPALAEAYGGYPTMEDLKSDESAYARFVELAAEMAPPAINSVPVYEFEEGDLGEMNKGFRFMGQRFTIDAAIMQRLVYRAVEENSAGEKRLLPDTLDVPAALGSDLALQLLEEQGDTDYSGYSENMTQLREFISGATEASWTSSLYSSWLYTLTPLLETKGEGWPSYMTSTEWGKKALETFAGSFTELKHDTVLYAKQVMAEMGGGPGEEIDDRGYVEPEPEVYRRFMLLAQQTAEGLEGFGLIDSGDVENLGRLEELARRLLTISNKELQNKTLTDEEYDLIREYGGTLEHFWIEAVKGRTDAEYPDPRQFPASLVTDIATDPNGRVLQVATGRPADILVIVPVDGQLRIASGVIYDFYQFEQPIGERLTDTEWRQMIGQEIGEDGMYTWMYNYDNPIEKPWWTESYWSQE